MRKIPALVIALLGTVLAPRIGVAQTALFTREVTTGLTKQCFYDYVGSVYTRTQSSVSICPLSIQVETRPNRSMPAPAAVAPQTAGVWDALAGIAQGMAADREAQRQRDLYQQQMTALEEHAAYLRSQRMLDSLNAINAAIERRRFAEQRKEEQWAVFLPRARYSLQKAVDSAMPSFDSARKEVWNVGAKRLSDLFSAQPTATNAEMADVLEPLIADYRPRYDRAVTQGRALIADVEDSLRLTGTARTRFTSSAADRLMTALNRNIETPEIILRHSLEPVVDSVRRARAAVRKPAAAKPPVKKLVP